MDVFTITYIVRSLFTAGGLRQIAEGEEKKKREKNVHSAYHQRDAGQALWKKIFLKYDAHKCLDFTSGLFYWSSC